MKNLINLTVLIIALMLNIPANAQLSNNYYKKEKINLFASSAKIENSKHSIHSVKRIFQDGESDDGKGAYLGLRFMPTFTSIDVDNNGDDSFSTEAVLGYGFGGLIGVNFSNHVGLQVEVIYSSLSQKYKYADNVSEIKLQYINIPLLLTLNTNTSGAVNLNVAVGPQLGINVGSDFDDSADGQATDTVRGRVVVKTGDIGFAYGAGLDFGLGTNVRLALGFRGVIGLVDISDRSQTLETDEFYVLDKTHVKTYAGYVGLTFGF